jgi:hypothetical protein
VASGSYGVGYDDVVGSGGNGRRAWHLQRTSNGKVQPRTREVLVNGSNGNGSCHVNIYFNGVVKILNFM